MIPTAQAVWEALLAWEGKGALATVLPTYGSSPRPAGSMAAIRADGAVVGAVSGGCIEAELIERVRRGLPSRPERLTFGGSDGENRRLGLPCGGRIELLWEPAPPAAVIRALLDALAARQPVARRVDFAGGSHLVPPAPDAVRLDAQGVTFTHRPPLRLLLIGAVEIARHLAEFANALEWEVIVCEPREEYRATWQVAGSRLVSLMPDEAARAFADDPAAAVIALTHDPRLDDMALMEALASRAFYVGALGSARNQDKRRERLALLDLAPEQIARLRGPVGLPLRSKRPAEIAVAILAELIAVNHGVRLVPQPEAATIP